MKLNISEAKGELSFGVIWLSADSRLTIEWMRTPMEALERYRYLKKLGRQPSVNIRVQPEDLE